MSGTQRLSTEYRMKANRFEVKIDSSAAYHHRANIAVDMHRYDKEYQSEAGLMIYRALLAVLIAYAIRMKQGGVSDDHVLL